MTQSIRPSTRRGVFILAAALGVAVICGTAPNAQAQAFKCKQSDGSVSFQDHACDVGSTGAAIATAPATRASLGPSTASRGSRKIPGDPAPNESWRDKERDFQQRRADQEARAENEKIAAYNRMQRCNSARQQLGVLKEPRPAFRRDNQGDRHYVEDADRPAEIARAQQRVADEC